MSRLPIATRPKILLVQGSPRAEDNCPNEKGKTTLLAEYLLDNAPPNVEMDYLDLSITGKSVVQPCKGCVSTGNGFHCHYPCDCYVSGSDKYPDLMHDEDVYQRLEEAAGILVLTPVHWYSVTSQVKAMFDRLVCINLTLTVEQAEELGVGKEAAKSRELERRGEHNHLLKNHYEGKYAAFFIHGDNGGADYQEYVPDDDAYHPSMPDSFLEHVKRNLSEGWINGPRNSVEGLAWQCRYSGIYVPEDLIVGFHATSGLSNSAGMDAARTNLEHFYKSGMSLLKRLARYITNNV